MAPLPDPVDRALSHERRITCHGYRRCDGLWDVEARLTDTKPSDVTEPGMRTLVAGEFIHDMWLRVTVDREKNIKQIETAIDSSPHHVCKQATASMSKLVGLQIGPGWSRRVKELVGARKGCTHLVELLGPLATTVYQTLYTDKMSESTADADEQLINTCQTYADDGQLVELRWPHRFRGSQQSS